MGGVNTSKAVGIISDVHGNADALAVVLAELNAMGVTDVHGLGDWVGYNMDSVDVLNQIERAEVDSVAGNHDLMLAGVVDGPASQLARDTLIATRSQLNRAQIEYLSSLPLQLVKRWHAGKAILVHGTPEEPIWGYLREDDLPSISIPTEYSFVLSGATHRPLVATMGDRTIINPGSVGIPRDGDPRASFAVIDTQSGQAEIHRVAYDPSKTAALNIAAGIPSTVNDYLFLGRASPSSVSIGFSRHAVLDETAGLLRSLGRNVVRNATGMQVEASLNDSGGLVIMAVLEKDHRLLIRSTSLPKDVHASGEIVQPPFMVVEAPDAAWVQMISANSIEQIDPNNITQWCEEIERIYVDSAKEGQRK